VLDERDVDGELSVPGQELLGAVERINQPVGLPRRANGRGGQAALLGDDREARREAGQPLAEQTVRRQIGLGER